jgi:hypothetical protein
MSGKLSGIRWPPRAEPSMMFDAIENADRLTYDVNPKRLSGGKSAVTW